MKLIYYTLLRISIALTLVLGIWATFFYMTMIDEVNDEVDDSLEDYSEDIIIWLERNFPPRKAAPTISIIW